MFFHCKISIWVLKSKIWKERISSSQAHISCNSFSHCVFSSFFFFLFISFLAFDLIAHTHTHTQAIFSTCQHQFINNYCYHISFLVSRLGNTRNKCIPLCVGLVVNQLIHYTTHHSPVNVMRVCKMAVVWTVSTALRNRHKIKRWRRRKNRFHFTVFIPSSSFSNKF